jgi:hypothetical protein
MKITLTGRTLENFKNKTVNFSIRARKVCLYLIGLTVNKRYQLLVKIDALMTAGKLAPVDCANIRFFCYDDFNKLYF